MLNPIPSNEESRLIELHSFSITDKPIGKEFDDLSKLAAFICKKNVALINFIDSDTQWSKATFGLNLSSMQRCDSVCKYTIMDNEYYEVSDLTKDERFNSKFYVKDKPNLRFYGGFPLRSQNGLNIGALCVMDYKPGNLNDEQKVALKTIAASIVTRLELQKQNLILTNSLKSNAKLLRVIGHDLRNPISGILGLTDFILSENWIENEDANQMIQLIYETSDKLQKYVAEILEGGLALEHISDEVVPSCKIYDVLDDTIQMYQTSALNKNISILFDKNSSPAKVKINATQLKQIIGNLISNAIKFTPVDGQITVHVNPSETGYLISISDTGIGIPHEILNNLFTESQQIRRTGTSGEISTGLGLPMIKEMIDLMGGSISVESVEHKGSTFKVFIPK